MAHPFSNTRLVALSHIKSPEAFSQLQPKKTEAFPSEEKPPAEYKIVPPYATDFDVDNDLSLSSRKIGFTEEPVRVYNLPDMDEIVSVNTKQYGKSLGRVSNGEKNMNQNITAKSKHGIEKVIKEESESQIDSSVFDKGEISFLADTISSNGVKLSPKPRVCIVRKGSNLNTALNVTGCLNCANIDSLKRQNEQINQQCLNMCEFQKGEIEVLRNFIQNVKKYFLPEAGSDICTSETLFTDRSNSLNIEKIIVDLKSSKLTNSEGRASQTDGKTSRRDIVETAEVTKDHKETMTSFHKIPCLRTSVDKSVNCTVVESSLDSLGNKSRNEFLHLALAARESLIQDLHNRVSRGCKVLKRKFQKLRTASLEKNSSLMESMVSSSSKFIAWLSDFLDQGVQEVHRFDEVNYAMLFDSGSSDYFYRTEIVMPGAEHATPGIFIPVDTGVMKQQNLERTPQKQSTPILPTDFTSPPANQGHISNETEVTVADPRTASDSSDRFAKSNQESDRPKEVTTPTSTSPGYIRIETNDKLCSPLTPPLSGCQPTQDSPGKSQATEVTSTKSPIQSPTHPTQASKASFKLRSTNKTSQPTKRVTTPNSEPQRYSSKTKANEKTNSKAFPIRSTSFKPKVSQIPVLKTPLRSKVVK